MNGADPGREKITGKADDRGKFKVPTLRNVSLTARVSLGVVFLWFGALKFVPSLSPAEGLAGATIARLSFGLVQPRAALAILAVWETAIGAALVLGV